MFPVSVISVSFRFTFKGSANRLRTTKCRTRKGGFMRAYRDIATLAATQLVCFLFLTHLEPDFFLVHLYQSILYIAILVMLFYMEDRWAYMIGMLASVVWLVMAYATGILGSAAQQLIEQKSSNLTATLVSSI